jgi:GT2 family glycosyltransferase
MTGMKLSIVILCWNDLDVIGNCLRSIYAGTHSTQFEVIVSDNGSTDGGVDFIRQNYSEVRVVENHANLGFSKGNNVGIRGSRGELVLILNPDTIIPEGALDKWVRFIDQHPEAGAFGCRILNPNGTFQGIPRPFPTLLGLWIAALFLRPFAVLSKKFVSDVYVGWKGESEKVVDWVCGACFIVRGDLVRKLGGFDEQFVYQFEETDLCRRIWKAGYRIVYTPEVTITHLGGQSTKEYPLPFELERYRNAYRYFYKYYGRHGARSYRRILLTNLRIRQVGRTLVQQLKPNDTRKKQIELFAVAERWNSRIDPVRLVEKGEEPDLGVKRTIELT